jgi:RNA polymerase sigma-70 factor (ECF subfamily)
MTMPIRAEFAVQLTRCQRKLHAFIVSMVWNPADADEVLQETNLVLWQKAAEFDESRPFLPWAVRFAQLQSLAWLKRNRRRPVMVDANLGALLAAEAAEETLFDRRRVALAACLQKLSPHQRELVMRRYEPEASVTAMAATAGVTPKAISDRLRRIRQALLDCINAKLGREALA